MAEQKQRGRPKGKAPQAPMVSAVATRCPVCGSTERQDYTNTMMQQYRGIAPDGVPYSRIVRRRTRCVHCGQVRIDRTYEYDPKE